MTIDEEIEKIITVLKSGGTILYPTDTVWGIGCDASNPEAVKKIRIIKGREQSKSMLILTDSINNLYKYSDNIPEIVFDLLGLTDSPLTVIVPEGKNVAPEILAGDGSIGIRVTNEEFTVKLISKFRKALVATSANISNKKTPLNFEEIDDHILKSVDYVVCNRVLKGATNKPSGLIKFYPSGEFKILRK